MQKRVTEPVAAAPAAKEEEPRVMLTSYYGAGFSGKLTANGERFNPRDFTAAHKTLPFNTLLNVTNPENGRSVVVRVNDRGPHVRGRELDLSHAAAESLGIIKKGVKRLEIRIASKPGEGATTKVENSSQEKAKEEGRPANQESRNPELGTASAHEWPGPWSEF